MLSARHHDLTHVNRVMFAVPIVEPDALAQREHPIDGSSPVDWRSKGTVSGGRSNEWELAVETGTGVLNGAARNGQCGAGVANSEELSVNSIDR